jgi:phenylacetate-CoA ligase
VGITETYGTVEMGVMAYQCQSCEGLNLIEDCTYFEFLDEQDRPVKPNQPGRLVVTDLNGGLMPFIRSDQGDLAAYSLRQNDRGENVRVIDSIIGRQDDLAPLPDGRCLTYLDFYELMDVYPGIGRFRVRQREPDLFILELVSSADYFRGIEREPRERLRLLSPLPLRFEIRQVDDISPDPSGKMRMLVSEVAK